MQQRVTLQSQVRRLLTFTIIVCKKICQAPAGAQDTNGAVGSQDKTGAPAGSQDTTGAPGSNDAAAALTCHTSEVSSVEKYCYRKLESKFISSEAIQYLLMTVRMSVRQVRGKYDFFCR